jgi:ABC-2 type transport system permease protein
MTSTMRPSGAVEAEYVRPTASAAFRGLMLRDVYVFRKNLKQFVPRTVLQPLLLVFIFAYVFPKIGRGVSSGHHGETFSTILAAGVLASVIFFQGLQAVAFPLVQEFSYTKEIEAQVLTPLRVELVAVQKILFGSLQCLVGAVVIFPLAKYVPATPVTLDVDWPVLITVMLLACVTSATLGLMVGSLFGPDTVPIVFGVILVPITFLGCIHYAWPELHTIRWLQLVVLLNPLTYMSEAFRAAITPVPHLSLWVSCAAMIACTSVFGWTGIRAFRRRVLS